MGQKGGSSQTTNSSSVSSPPPQVMADYQALVNRATNAANTPYQQYPGELVAPLSNQTVAGLGGVNAYANAAQPFYGAAAAGTSAAATPISATPFSAGEVGKYMNPYTNDVVASTQNEFNNQNQEQAQFLNSQNISSGAFGGDRAGVSQAVLANQQQTAQAPVIAGLYNQAYNQALSEFNTQQGVGLQTQAFNNQQLGQMSNQISNIGTAAQNAGLQGAMGQLQAGMIPQQEQQAIDTALYNQYMQQQSYPFQTSGWLGNIIEGVGSLSGGTTAGTSTTTSQVGNPISSGIGAGLSGLGVLGNLGILSDKEAKEDIRPVGKTFDGQTIYRFRYKGDPRTQIGLIAQETERHHPEAVHHSGLRSVDYDAATRAAADRGHFALGGAALFGGRVRRDSGGAILNDYFTPTGQGGVPGALSPFAGQAANLYDQITANSKNPAYSIDESVVGAIGSSPPNLGTPYTQVPGPAVTYPAINWQNPSADFQTAGAEGSLAGLINRPGIETPMTQSQPTTQAPASTQPAAVPNMSQWEWNNALINSLSQPGQTNVGRGGTMQTPAALSDPVGLREQNNQMFGLSPVGAAGPISGANAAMIAAGGPNASDLSAIATGQGAALRRGGRVSPGRIFRAAGGQLGQSGIGAALAQPPQGAMVNGQGQGEFGNLFGGGAPRRTFASGGGANDPAVGADPFAEVVSWVPPVVLSVPGHGPPQPQNISGGGGSHAAPQQGLSGGGGGSGGLSKLAQQIKSHFGGDPGTGASDVTPVTSQDLAQLPNFSPQDQAALGLSNADFSGLIDAQITGGPNMDASGGIGMMRRGGAVRRQFGGRAHFDDGGDVALDDPPIDESWRSDPYGGHSMDYGPPPDASAAPPTAPASPPGALFPPTATPLPADAPPTPLSPAGGVFVNVGGKQYPTDKNGYIVGGDAAPPGPSTPADQPLATQMAERQAGARIAATPGLDALDRAIATGDASGVQLPGDDPGQAAARAIGAAAGPAQGNVGKSTAGAMAGLRGSPFMNAMAQIESNNRNIYSGVDPDVEGPNSRSQGFWQIDNPTWREFAPPDIFKQYPRAMLAPRDVQQAVAENIPLSRFGPRTQRMIQAQYGPLNTRETLGQLAASAGGGGGGGGQPQGVQVAQNNQVASAGGGGQPQGVQVAQNNQVASDVMNWSPQGKGGQPYFQPQDVSNPWSNKRELFNAMMYAGFAMMGGESLNPWVNIGRGAMAGMQYMQKQNALDRDWAEKQAQIEHLSHQDRVADADVNLRSMQTILEWKKIGLANDYEKATANIDKEEYGGAGAGASPQPTQTPAPAIPNASPAKDLGAIGAPGASETPGAPPEAVGAEGQIIPNAGAALPYDQSKMPADLPPYMPGSGVTGRTAATTGQPSMGFPALNAPQAPTAAVGPQPGAARGASSAPPQTAAGAAPMGQGQQQPDAAEAAYNAEVARQQSILRQRAAALNSLAMLDSTGRVAMAQNQLRQQARDLPTKEEMYVPGYGVMPNPGLVRSKGAIAGAQETARLGAETAPGNITGQAELARAKATGEQMAKPIYDAQGHAYLPGSPGYEKLAAGEQPYYAAKPPEAVAEQQTAEAFQKEAANFNQNYQYQREMMTNLADIYRNYEPGRGAEEVAELAGWAHRLGLDGVLPKNWRETGQAGFDAAMKMTLQAAFKTMQDAGGQRAPRTFLQEALQTSPRPEAAPAAVWNMITHGVAALDYQHDLYNAVGDRYDVNAALRDFNNKANIKDYLSKEQKEIPLPKGTTFPAYRLVTGKTKFLRSPDKRFIGDPDTGATFNAATGALQ